MYVKGRKYIGYIHLFRIGWLVVNLKKEYSYCNICVWKVTTDNMSIFEVTDFIAKITDLTHWRPTSCGPSWDFTTYGPLFKYFRYDSKYIDNMKVYHQTLRNIPLSIVISSAGTRSQVHHPKSTGIPLPGIATRRHSDSNRFPAWRSSPSTMSSAGNIVWHQAIKQKCYIYRAHILGIKYNLNIRIHRFATFPSTKVEDACIAMYPHHGGGVRG